MSPSTKDLDLANYSGADGRQRNGHPACCDQDGSLNLYFIDKPLSITSRNIEQCVLKPAHRRGTTRLGSDRNSVSTLIESDNTASIAEVWPSSDQCITWLLVGRWTLHCLLHRAVGWATAMVGLRSLLENQTPPEQLSNRVFPRRSIGAPWTEPSGTIRRTSQGRAAWAPTCRHWRRRPCS